MYLGKTKFVIQPLTIIMIINPHTWIEISASAFAHNVQQYKNIPGPRALAIVIKANAYGHGLPEVAQLCETNNNVDWLCTFSLSEALQARNYNQRNPILVLGLIDADIDDAINQNIAFIISDYKTAQELNTCGKLNNYCFDVHVKVDTGLARFGVMPDKTVAFIKEILRLPNIKISGICSHFAKAPSEDQTYTLKQLNAFNTVLNKLEKHNIAISFKHVANSAAATAYHIPACNLFRVGIGAYGYWPSPANKRITQQQYPDFTLKPILTWKTRVAQIKELPAGQFVGYEGTYITSKKTHLAFLPVGYYDGYNPGLSNKGYVYINNKPAPIVGRVAMDAITIDVTDIAANVGDEVILLGNYPQVTGSDLASHAEINNVRYITTAINPVIARNIID